MTVGQSRHRTSDSKAVETATRERLKQNTMIQFTYETLSNLSAATSREWLETNGLGGFASSTVEGLNTRRYHGLLVAALPPPVGRAVLLSKFEETLFLGGRAYELGCNQYPGVLHPRGFQYLQEFRLDPFPTFLYRAEQTTIEKRVVMLHGRNAVVLLYTAQGAPPDAALELAPLLAY